MLENSYQLPRLSEMVGLYRSCMGLSRDAEALLRASYRLKQLALNSEVFSVQAADSGRVFQSLSKETKQLSQNITTVLKNLIENVESISHRAIESAARTRLCEKYHQAITLGTRSSTAERIVARQKALEGQLTEALLTVFQSLHRSHRMMNDMERLHHQLPVIATLMKIEANRSSEFQNTFYNNAESLLQLNLELKEAMQGVRRKTADALMLIRKITRRDEK